MPCSVLEAVLEPPLAPLAIVTPSATITAPPFGNPQLTGEQMRMMRSAQIEFARRLQQIQVQQQMNVESYYQALNQRRARNLPMPSDVEIAATVANIRATPPQMQQLSMRALDHCRILAIRGRLPAQSTRRYRSGFSASHNSVRKSSRGLVCMNPVIGRIREANRSWGSRNEAKSNIPGLDGKSEAIATALSEKRSSGAGQLNSKETAKRRRRDS
ncbi:hypothetical protein TWF481_002070 [Arthrobotrys musiformis]|uniref:Uncharacterized protein n=1 Tax=Arthrobotrys musiformis TaxID=47236 RepID=A0AAV9VY81_9PEZI